MSDIDRFPVERPADANHRGRPANAGRRQGAAVHLGPQIIGAYLLDFTLEEGETAEDYYRPAIIPSAPAKKPAGGGH